MGLNIGLVLFIVCFSGTCATLSHELDDLLGGRPDGGGCSAIDWAAVERGARTLPGHVSHLMTRDACGPVSALHHPDGGEIERVAIHRTSGEILGQGSPFTIQEFLRQFHKALLLPKGIYLVSLTSLVLGYAVMSGLLVYRRWWSHLRRLRWRRGPRVLWSDIHRTLGVWTSIFGVLMVVTGLWYLVESGARDAVGFVAEPPIPKMDRDRLRELPPQPERLPLAELVGAAQRAIPGLDARAVHFPIRLGDALQVDGQSGAWLVRDRANRVYLDPYDGNVLGRKDVDELTPLERWADTADVLHFGTFGGLPTKIVWFVFGLLLSLVCLAGPVLWHLRKNRVPADRERPRRLRRTRGFLPHVPVLLLLLASAGSTVQAVRSSPLRGGPPITRASAPTQVGPWSVVMNFRESGRSESARGIYRVFAADRGDPMWTSASIELPGDAKPRPMRVSLRGVGTSAPAADKLTLRLVDPAGATHKAQFALEPVAAAAAPAPGPIPTYVSAFVLAFMLLQIAGAVAWAVIIRRRFADEPAPAETPGTARVEPNPPPQRNTP